MVFAAFPAYFKELGVQVNDRVCLFTQMTDEGVTIILQEAENEQAVGCIMVSRIEMTSWFFEDRYGFIQEFRVEPEQRDRGIGSRGVLRTAGQSARGF